MILLFYVLIIIIIIHRVPPSPHPSDGHNTLRMVIPYIKFVPTRNSRLYICRRIRDWFTAHAQTWTWSSVGTHCTFRAVHDDSASDSKSPYLNPWFILTVRDQNRKLVLGQTRLTVRVCISDVCERENSTANISATSSAIMWPRVGTNLSCTFG